MPSLFRYEYAAKTVCVGVTTFDGPVIRGLYASAINVHNPHPRVVRVRYKVALAGSPDTEPGGHDVSAFHTAALGPDEAFEIDCLRVFDAFCPDQEGACLDAFATGFVVLQSPLELDVVGVYTTRPKEGQVSSIDVEQVSGRRIHRPAPQPGQH